jgi:hypothetical protein
MIGDNVKNSSSSPPRTQRLRVRNFLRALETI